MTEEGEKKGTHPMTSSKGVKMQRVLTTEFGDSIIRFLVKSLLHR